VHGVTWIKQSGFRIEAEDLTIYIDPWDVPSEAPTADVVFVSHAHDDHFSPGDLDRLRTDGTVIVAPHDVAARIDGDVVGVSPDDTLMVLGIAVAVVHAYNVAEDRRAMHPRERGWVGYVLSAGGTRWYHAGDTDHVPELDTLSCDVAFLPVDGEATMTPVEAASLAARLAPRVAVPMHFGWAHGSHADAERFRSLATVEVEIMDPLVPFARRAA
jgi:L-ascorbate metabolism protein UlaG (beta-lactamase superfamily)